MMRILEHTAPKMPEQKPRYLMGVGKPEDFIEAVRRGIDMFDRVMPTRNAQWPSVYQFWRGKIRNAVQNRYLSVG